MARFAGTALNEYFNTPDFTTVGKTNMQGQALQRNTATKAEGLVHGAGVNSMAAVAQAGFQADAIKAEGAAAGQSAIERYWQHGEWDCWRLRLYGKRRQKLIRWIW